MLQWKTRSNRRIVANKWVSKQHAAAAYYLLGLNTHTFLFLDLMLLNILFSVFLDGKYLTVRVHAACSVPAKATRGLKEDFEMM